MEKLLVTSNFSFSHSVLKRLELQTHKNQQLIWENGGGLSEQLENTLGKGEIAHYLPGPESNQRPPFLKSCRLSTELYRLRYPFPNKPWFLRVYSTSILKPLWEKQKLLVTSNFSFLHSVF